MAAVLHACVRVVARAGRSAGCRARLQRCPAQPLLLHPRAHTCTPHPLNKQVGEFGGDNRGGIDRTLHRISCIRNRAGRVVGLTCRVGRAIQGSAAMVADLATAGKSILLLGARSPPRGLLLPLPLLLLLLLLLLPVCSCHAGGTGPLVDAARPPHECCRCRHPAPRG